VANSASAEKRIRQNERDRERNRARKAALKTETRKFLEVLLKGDFQSARESFSRLQKRIDQIAAHGTLHRNTAARRKARLARRLNQAIAAAAPVTAST